MIPKECGFNQSETACGWEDCVKRDLREAEEEEKWREKANNRDQWKQIAKVAIPRSEQ